MSLEELLSRPVVEVARELIGWTLVHGGCAGEIVETEAYHQREPACHAYVGRTPRSQTLFGAPGIAYVYRSYGIHALFNVVAEPEDLGAATLIRAIEPVAGLDAMAQRRGQADPEGLASGPGKLTQALDIGLELNGSSLLGDGPIRLLAPEDGAGPPALVSGTRIGITRGVDLPWRFCASESRYVSRPWPPGLGATRVRRSGLGARTASAARTGAA